MTFVAGTVLTAAALNTALAAKSDYAPTQNTQTGTGASAYTFELADASRLTVANAATAATYTIPPSASVTWVANTIINVASIGAGTITFAAGAGVTVTNTAGTLGQYQSAMLVRTALNAWTVVPFAGGASLLKSSDVSATTGSPTITTSGGFTIYDFLGSGSITFGKAGLCDLLVIGGGGSGATVIGGGGGAGGLLALANAYMPSGTQTVVVGAGGVGNTDEVGTNGVTSRLGSYYAVGGGAGGATTAVARAGGVGGSGGGSGSTANVAHTAGTGISGQGNDGGATVPGSSGNRPSGGGGGSGAVGVAGAAGVSGNGGAGTASSITGSSVTYAGGGGGGGSATTAGTGGTGGGGAGARTSNATNGTANLGGGGGGTDGPYKGGNGGSGRTIVRVLT